MQIFCFNSQIYMLKPKQFLYSKILKNRISFGNSHILCCF